MPPYAHHPGNEAFDPAALGHAEEVVETRVGDGEMIYIKVRGVNARAGSGGFFFLETGVGGGRCVGSGG